MSASPIPLEYCFTKPEICLPTRLFENDHALETTRTASPTTSLLSKKQIASYPHLLMIKTPFS